MQPLTHSGAGVRIAADMRDAGRFAAHLRELVETHRFVVVEDAGTDLAEIVALLGRLGPVNCAETRTAGAVLVEDRGDGEVFRSKAALPLHKDGVLTGFDVVLVGIYCMQFDGVTGGRTFVSDAAFALEQLPVEFAEVLARNGMEALALDTTDYYRPEFQGAWHPFPAFRARSGQAATPNLGMPHAEGEPASWRVRVAGVDANLSDRILDALCTCLLREDVLYHHDWKPGDLLLMDNYRVMHGREAFEGGPRVLANIQVLAD